MSDRPNEHAENAPWMMFVIAGWVVPGLGHYLAGWRTRGIIVGLTLVLLFTSGLMVGGVCVVDSKRQTLWFAGQLFIGPGAYVLDRWHHSLNTQLERQFAEHARRKNWTITRANYHRRFADFLADPDAPKAYTHSIARVNELGTLYCTLAGVMNLLVLLDLVGRLTSPEPVAHDYTDDAHDRRKRKTDKQT